MPDDAHSLHDRTRRVKTLPTLPGVVKKLCTLVDDESVTTQQIGEIVNSDQVLAAKVLKIVNSPFYGFPGRISTVNHALVLLGFNVIKGIVLSAAVIDYMGEKVSGFWEHSLGVATAAGIIAHDAQIDDPEEVSTAGLLHDLGKVILRVEMPDENARVEQHAEEAEISWYEAEREVLEGTTHCEIAGWLAEEWNLPPRLREPITLHHRPDRAEQAPVPVAAVHLANVLTRGLQFGWGGDPYVPPLSPWAMDQLRLRMGDLPDLIYRIDEELQGIDTSDFT